MLRAGQGRSLLMRWLRDGLVPGADRVLAVPRVRELDYYLYVAHLPR